MATHFPHYSTNFDKYIVTFYKVLAFEKYLLESALLNSVELTENGVQLFHPNMPFFFKFSDPYAMTLTLKRQGHTIIG